MFRIVRKTDLSAPNVSEYVVEAPRIARKAQAGQFVLVRVADGGERIPLTLADWDAEAGTITLVVQAVGHSTRLMAMLKSGDAVADVLGPLGEPSEVRNYGTVVCLGGGIGGAPIHPIARAQRAAGNGVITVLGVRSQDLLFWTDKLEAVSDEFYITSDDGSIGQKGFAVDVLKDLVNGGRKVDLSYAIGPVRMMQASSAVARSLGVPMVVSLNPIMVDGTGMCGGCRVYVGGKMRYACTEGPEFDGWEVDFEALINRQQMYRTQEGVSNQKPVERCSLEVAS